MPDLLGIAFSGDLLSLRFVAQANGYFTDGSRGKVQVTEVGILDNGFRGRVADGFPAENILLIPTRKSARSVLTAAPGACAAVTAIGSPILIRMR